MAGNLFFTCLHNIFCCLFWRRASEIVIGVFKRTRRKSSGMPQAAHTKVQTQVNKHRIVCFTLTRWHFNQALVNNRFSVLTGWKKVFWNFIVMGSTKNGYLDHEGWSSTVGTRIDLKTSDTLLITLLSKIGQCKFDTAIPTVDDQPYGIGFRTKKYPFTRILVSGHDQSWALPPHPTVFINLNW